MAFAAMILINDLNKSFIWQGYQAHKSAVLCCKFYCKTDNEFKLYQIALYP